MNHAHYNRYAKWYGITKFIHYGMNFSISAAFWYNDSLVFCFFPLLSLWCTLQDVESIERSFISASVHKLAMMSTNISSWFHRRKCAYTACHFPYRSGSFRHGNPFLLIQSIPFMIQLLSYFAGRPSFPFLRFLWRKHISNSLPFLICQFMSMFHICSLLNLLFVQLLFFK